MLETPAKHSRLEPNFGISGYVANHNYSSLAPLVLYIYDNKALNVVTFQIKVIRF